MMGKVLSDAGLNQVYRAVGELECRNGIATI